MAISNKCIMNASKGPQLCFRGWQNGLKKFEPIKGLVMNELNRVWCCVIFLA